MATRIPVSGPEPWEESRQLAEAMADLHYVMGLIVENATQLIPGETVDELKAAWDKSKVSMENLVRRLIRSSPPSTDYPPISDSDLEKGQLTGEIGKVKRSTLGRLKDCFFSFWNSEPRTNEKIVKASDAAAKYLEFGATIVSSIPGYEHVVEVVSLVKQLLGVRAERGT